ncbi:MAG: right-handed parallel beta-helix repeat-containing protein [Planctomycetota bacterium]|jgi:hypothetical protein
MKQGVWFGLFLISIGTVALARTYYVSTGGNDENPGSEARPLRTIQKASDLARAGDTILVHGGVYREAVVLRFSGQEGKPIILRNYPGEQPVIQPGELGRQPPGHGVLLQAQEGYQNPIGWITIEGLDVRYGHDGIKLYNAHDIVICKCNIHENWNQGILGNGNRVLIDRCIIANNGRNKDTAQNLIHGIYAAGTAFTVTNNLIHSNTAYGIQVAAYDYKEDSMAGPEYAEAKNWLIANNTIALNKNRAGIVIWQDGVENCVVQNNIFYKNGGVNGILFYTQQDRRHLIRSNIFYPPGDNLVATEDNAYEATDNLQVDPAFVDVTAFDFNLKAGSPAIDAGAADRAPCVDFEGRPRPQGDKVDIGAHEFSPRSGPLRLHPDNPHYFQFREEPAVLITSGEHYGAVINLDFDYIAYLEELARHDFNHTRLFTGTYREIPGSFGIQGNTLAPASKRYAAPWARSNTPGYFDGGNKFDLTRWDEAYFKRLKDFVGQAAKRGIVVEVTLFCTMYSEELWKASPMHVANNINGIGRVGRYEVYGLKEDALTEAQAAVTRKIVRELNPFDNVYYEICNEPYERGGMHPDWQGRMITEIRETETSLVNRHLISLNFAHGSAKVAAPHPDVSIYNFHAAKPEGVMLNYGLQRAIGHNETGGSRRDDATYRTQGWEFILAGGALFSHLDFSFATTHPRGTLLDHRGPGGGGAHFEGIHSQL